MDPDPPPSSTPPGRSPLKLKAKTDFAVANPPVPSGEVSPDHDVRAWLQQAANGTRPPIPTDDPNGLEFPDLAPQPARPNRKRRDYLILLLGGNGVLGAITFFGQGNPFILVCGIAGITVFTLGLTWVMWAVMGRY